MTKVPLRGQKSVGNQSETGQTQPLSLSLAYSLTLLPELLRLLLFQFPLPLLLLLLLVLLVLLFLQRRYHYSILALGRFLTGFWQVSDWFLTDFWPFRGTLVKWRKAKAKIPRCSSGSGVAVVAALVVILKVVATLVEGSAHERIRFHIWEEKKIAWSGNSPENSQ